jgi:GNAT superfamily N-acetyltransferase
MIRAISGAALVRRAGQDDLAAVTELCAAHAAYERAAFDPVGHAGRLADAIDGTSPRIVLLIAEISERPVGYAAISREFSTWAGRDYLHMDCLFVYERRRGQGIGRQLFEAVLHEARTSGIAGVQWQTPDWNENAIQFYRALGAADAAKARFALWLS